MGKVFVANVVGLAVAIYRYPPIERNVNGLSVAEPERASCGAVVEARFKRYWGVVVPIPSVPREVLNAELLTAPNVEAPALYWSSVPEPPGVPPPLPERQVFDIA